MQGMNLTFSNFEQFCSALQGLNISSNQRLVVFRDMATGINGGCGCNRQSRIDFCKNIYRQMETTLTNDNKTAIKQKLNVQSVSLAEGDAIFYNF